MNRKEQKFVNEVWEYYRRHGRQSLPWRLTPNPYHIVVSEIMLQQTQADRVIPKYKSFLKRFPTWKALARAPLGDVLREWQGLGYNRRGKMLHELGREVSQNYRGTLPKDVETLISLPGIGPYTAGAVLVFAFNTPVPIIETNIRSVYLHHFFLDETDITDAEIVRLIVLTLDVKNPREWYYALMDYGVYIKKTYGNPNRRSKHYASQSTFKGSDREIRGAILRVLSEQPYTREKLLKLLPFEDIRIDAQLVKLMKERMIIQTSKKFSLPG